MSDDDPTVGTAAAQAIFQAAGGPEMPHAKFIHLCDERKFLYKGSGTARFLPADLRVLASQIVWERLLAAQGGD